VTIVERKRETLVGIRRVEREIIEQLRARGAQVTASNFSWNNGASLAELPDLIHLEVRVRFRELSRYL
jgi:hypothetical protein